MDKSKDYYAILGVTPSSEEVVIKAAYRALAQKYHPDRWSGSQEAANSKMAEINEAYRVLSNSESRKKYDSLRGADTQDSSTFFDDDPDNGSNSPLDSEWEFAIEYYPELDKLSKDLSKISWRLAFSFKAYLIESKQFDRASQVANGLRNEFLKVYFGESKPIRDFALHLVYIGNRSAARELNKAIKILGDKANPERVISTIRSKYGIDENKTKSYKSENSGENEESAPNGYTEVKEYSKSTYWIADQIVAGIQDGTIEGVNINDKWFVKLDYKGEPQSRKAEKGEGCFSVISIIFVFILLTWLSALFL